MHFQQYLARVCVCVCVWYPATSYSGFILRPRAQRSWESLRIHRHPHQDPGLSLLKTNQWLNLSHETHQSGQPMNFIVVRSNGKTSRLQYASVKPAPSGAVRYGCVLQVVRTKRTAENFACFHECTLYYASKQDDKKKAHCILYSDGKFGIAHGDMRRSVWNTELTGTWQSEYQSLVLSHGFIKANAGLQLSLLIYRIIKVLSFDWYVHIIFYFYFFSWLICCGISPMPEYLVYIIAG